VSCRRQLQINFSCRQCAQSVAHREVCIQFCAPELLVERQLVQVLGNTATVDDVVDSTKLEDGDPIVARKKRKVFQLRLQSGRKIGKGPRTRLFRNQQFRLFALLHANSLGLLRPQSTCLSVESIKTKSFNFVETFELDHIFLSNDDSINLRRKVSSKAVEPDHGAYVRNVICLTSWSQSLLFINI
jgi:hypothetical protein